MPIIETDMSVAGNPGVTLDYLQFAEALANNRFLQRSNGKEGSLQFAGLEGGLDILSVIDSTGKQQTRFFIGKDAGKKEVSADYVNQVIMTEAQKVSAALKMLTPDKLPTTAPSIFFSSIEMNGVEAHDVRQIGLGLASLLGFEKHVGGWANRDGTYNPSSEGFKADLGAMHELDHVLSQPSAPISAPAPATPGTTAPAAKPINGSALVLKNAIAAGILPNPVPDPAATDKAAATAAAKKAQDQLAAMTSLDYVKVLTRTKSAVDANPVLTEQEAAAALDKAGRDRFLTRVGAEEAIPVVDGIIGNTAVTADKIIDAIVADGEKRMRDAATKAGKPIPAEQTIPKFIVLSWLGFVDGAGILDGNAAAQPGQQPAQQQQAPLTTKDLLLQTAFKIGGGFLDSWRTKKAAEDQSRQQMLAQMIQNPALLQNPAALMMLGQNPASLGLNTNQLSQGLGLNPLSGMNQASFNMNPLMSPYQQDPRAAQFLSPYQQQAAMPYPYNMRPGMPQVYNQGMDPRLMGMNPLMNQPLYIS